MKKLLKFFGYAVLLICLLAGIWTYWFVLRGIPSIHDLQKIKPTKLSKVIASDGSTIAYFPPEGRIELDGTEIPLRVKQAFIAAEDATFYEHTGLDWKRIFSALITDIRATSYVQGASTITQQVVRSYLLTREKTITRKLKEVILALRIEKALSKDRILSLYLSRVYLGSGAYGVEAASLRFFNKNCRELALAEIAMITGLAPAPAKYTPFENFNAAKKRQLYVLKRMSEEGFISDIEAQDAYQEPLKITGVPIAKFTRYPYLTDYISKQVSQRYGEEIFSKGINIQTTINPELQDIAIAAMRKGAIDLEIRQGIYRGPENGASETFKSRKLALQINQVKWKGFESYHLYWAEVIQTAPLIVNLGAENIELGPESYAWIHPKGNWDPQDELVPGDLIQLCYTGKGFLLSQEPRVQAALVAFDLQSSGVIALVGGVDYSKSQFNRAVSALRQSGSAIKPFIYAAAIDKGFTPASIIFDTPITYRTEEDEQVWKPKNYENRFYGATTLRTGLVLSRNVVTVKVLKEIGISHTISYLKRFDLGSELPRDLSLALGSGVITPFNLARAYATFASYGQLFEPRSIEYIIQQDVGPIFSARQGDLMEIQSSSEKKEQIISEQTAYIITNILNDVVQEGTGWRVRALKRPVAGKTGTSDENRDAWFLGYTPDILCAVWVGYDDMVPLGENETGSRAASPIFLDFMKAALKNKPISDFRVPDGIVFARVNTTTGRIASSNSEAVRFECFKENTLPPKEASVTDESLLKEVY